MTWNILTTDPRREFSVAGHLVGHGVTTYLPTYQARVRPAPNTGRPWRIEDRPLFPGYLFARLAGGDAWKAVHCAAGCSGYLRGPEGPKMLSDAAIALVRQVEKELSISASEPDCSRFSAGDHVRIDQDGNPWTGLEGIIASLDNNERITLELVNAGNKWRVRVPIECLREVS